MDDLIEKEIRLGKALNMYILGGTKKLFFSPPLTASQSSREKEMMKMTHELLQSLKIRQLLFYIWKVRLVCFVAIFLFFFF